jgi:hypothetical protein
MQVQLSLWDAVDVIRIELRTQGGKLLVRKLFNRDQLPAGDRYSDEIEFETPVSPATAFLIVGMDDTSGKPLAVSSVRIDLLSSGVARSASEEWQAKGIDIQLPAFESEIEGGTLDVSGLTRLDPDSPLKVQVIDEETGKIVGQRLAKIDDTGKGPLYPFSAQTPYQVRQRTNARLVVFRDQAPDGLILYLASLPVILNP